jgi:DNA-3-methyladenine glycosylase
MYGPGGHAYVYFTYGIHWLLNCVCREEGYPAAVLIRSIFPVEGLSQIKLRRQGRKPEDWCNGPAKICQALSINGLHNGSSLCEESRGLWIENGPKIEDSNVETTPRVGINSVPEPWLSKPWRFLVRSPSKIFAKG